MGSEGLKYDGEKPRLELLSRAALEGTAKVLTFGASKYTRYYPCDCEAIDSVEHSPVCASRKVMTQGADNWRKGMVWRRLIGAAMRHLQAFADGEDRDPESGLPHIDHLQCCAMFLSEYQKHGLGTDDRYKPETKKNVRRPSKTSLRLQRPRPNRKFTSKVSKSRSVHKRSN